MPDERRAAAVKDEVPHSFKVHRPVGGHPVSPGSDDQLCRSVFPAVLKGAVQRIDIVGRIGGDSEISRPDDASARIRRLVDRKLLCAGRQCPPRPGVGCGISHGWVVTVLPALFDKPEIGDLPFQLPVSMNLKCVIRSVSGTEFDPDRPEGGAAAASLEHRIKRAVSGRGGPAEETQVFRIHIRAVDPAAERRDVSGGRLQHAGRSQENRGPLVPACRRVDPEGRAVRRRDGERLPDRITRGVAEIPQDHRFAGRGDQRGTGGQGGHDPPQSRREKTHGGTPFRISTDKVPSPPSAE